MATKKKEELAQEEMPLTLDAEMPLDGQEDVGPLEGEAAAEPSAMVVDEQPGDSMLVDGSGTEADVSGPGGADAEPATTELPVEEESPVLEPNMPVKETAAAADPPAPTKPKRAPRKKKAPAKSGPQAEGSVPPHCTAGCQLC